MNNRLTTFTTILLALGFLGLSPTTKALLPPPAPDGGYPGGNTAEGVNALHDVNTAVGINNTAVGANALTHDTTGYYNVAFGSWALESNTTGNFNMAIGAEALTHNNANFNLAIGFRVLFMNTTGSHLTGIGAAALRNNTTAGFNTAIGADALKENTTGEDNTAIGADALSSNTDGDNNTATGVNALFSNTTGDSNTAVGWSALFTNDTGIGNTAIGSYALQNNSTSTGSFNTAIGMSALIGDTTGMANTALGQGAGAALTSENYNIDIANTGVVGDFGTIRIGNNVVNHSTYIAGISGGNAIGGDAVFVTSDGRLGTVTSSAHFKREIEPMGKASEAILALRPVSFRYKKELDPQGTSQFGLVAEDVEKVNPDLVVHDKEGKPYSVHYDRVNAMLLNEFLKEHHTVLELKKEIAALTATVKDQAAQIQKVNATINLNRAAPQMAVNNP
jgi:Chaperone of endosialidase